MIWRGTEASLSDQPGNGSDSACDLCGCTRAYFCCPESDERLRTQVCSNCGLIYASPLPSLDENELANLNNHGDQGSRKRNPSGVLSDRDLRSEEHYSDWALDIIERFVNVPGSNFLTLRCRSGSLNARLAEKGAKVWGVDSYEMNVQYARQVRGLSDISIVPMSQLHELNLPFGLRFDVVAAMNEHVLGHVRSPRILLKRIFDLLKPGGHLFLEEKDVLMPAPNIPMFVLDSGQAHLFHLTVHTVARYVQSAGFEILECEIDPRRRTVYDHLRLIALKPHAENPSTNSASVGVHMPEGKAVLRQVRALERARLFRTWKRTMNSRARQSLKRVPGMERAWRLSQQFFRH